MLLQHVNKDSYREIRILDGGDADIDMLANQASPARRFLRSSWFRAATSKLGILTGRRSDDSLLMALPFTTRSIGPVRIREVGGAYWPFRSFAIARDAAPPEVAAFLMNEKTVRRLGRIWRMGPVYSDDPTAQRLAKAASQTGWTVIRRPTARVFEVDLNALRNAGPWPRTKTLRKNRWRERRLAEDGELRYEFCTGANWSEAHRDAMAEIEANSWLATLEDGGDTKFLDRRIRAIWECAADDNQLAPMLFASLLWIGDRPAAFAFGIENGDTRYYIANNYDERFAKFGPGKLLLYKDFERAADSGTRRISWGAGDAGYKSEMGAEPGPEIADLFFVRGKLLATLLRPLLMRGAYRDEGDAT